MENNLSLQSRINSLQLREELEGENPLLNSLISLLILEEYKATQISKGE